ncbi:MAG: rRNA pseudouridine synthase [Oscillospiraceae bacterium]|nr:rRNA pseudouridine synthase [Oscillospiraceae bacterium]
MRLQKYIASCGVCSRRRAEELIRAGHVTVNGRAASLGESVEEGDAVCLDGKKLTPPASRTYVMLNKPRGYVTTASDEHGRPTVLSLVKDAGVRLFPVGRLDFESEGLLILTDDGDMAQRLAHPSHGVAKTYRVTVRGTDIAAAAEGLRRPMTWEGVAYRAAEVRIVRASEDRAVLDVTVREGKNREVRNMCAAVSLRVERLVRIRQGELALGALPSGEWRYLTEKEMEFLRSLE